MILDLWDIPITIAYNGRSKNNLFEISYGVFYIHGVNVNIFAFTYSYCVLGFYGVDQSMLEKKLV